MILRYPTAPIRNVGFKPLNGSSMNSSKQRVWGQGVPPAGGINSQFSTITPTSTGEYRQGYY